MASASGALSSGIGSGIDALGGDLSKATSTKINNVKASQIFGGAVGGGLGAVISGGNFWSGFGTGLSVGLFNHAMEAIQQEIRGEDIAEKAENYWKSQTDKWSKEKEPFPGKQKCSTFVNDILEELGIYPDIVRTIRAGEWANPDFVIDGFIVVKDGTIQKGDIIAYQRNYAGASGHVGIMHNESKIYYAGLDTVKRASIFADGWKNPNWIVRRYVGKL